MSHDLSYGEVAMMQRAVIALLLSIAFGAAVAFTDWLYFGLLGFLTMMGAWAYTREMDYERYLVRNYAVSGQDESQGGGR